jgi:signal transduction histidine kinase
MIDGNLSISRNPIFLLRGLSIRVRLLLIVGAATIPMFVLVAGVVSWLANKQAEAERYAIMYSARSIQGAVDAQLGKLVAVGRSLATSPALQTQDLAAFRAEAERAVHAVPGARVILADPRGQQLINTAAAAGTPLPLIRPATIAEVDRAFETKEVQYTADAGVRFVPVRRALITVAGLTVLHGEEPAYYLQIGILAEGFRDLLNAQAMPEGWLAGIIDLNGDFVARSLEHERWVGKSAPDGWRKVMHEEGIFEWTSLEGNPLMGATVMSSISGWAIEVAVRKNVFEAPVRHTVAVASVIGLAVLLISVTLAAWIARTITVPFKVLESGAKTLQRLDTVAFESTSVPEFDHAMRAFQSASTALVKEIKERKQAEECMRSLQAELMHAARLGAAGEVSAALVHELGQPLASIGNYIEAAQVYLSHGDSEGTALAVVGLKAAQEDAAHAREVLRSLRRFLRREPAESAWQWIDVDEMVRESVELGLAGTPRGGDVQIGIPPELPAVYGNRIHLQQAIANLVRNAAEAMIDSPRRRLDVSATVNAESDHIEIAISDTGPGFPSASATSAKEDPFQPFVTTKPGGMGLGLPLARRIAEEHQGRLWAEPNPGGGSKLRLVIPIIGEVTEFEMPVSHMGDADTLVSV